MILWKQYLENNKVDICGITETHLKNTKIRRKQMRTKNNIGRYQTAEFHKFFTDQYIVITKNRRNQRGRRGHAAIGILIKTNVGKVKEIERKRNDCFNMD